MSKEFVESFGFWGTLVGLLVGIIGMYFSWNAWNESRQTKKLVENEKKRLNEKVGIILTDQKREFQLPKLRRQDITRSEVQGRIAVGLKNKAERYSLEYLNTPEFFRQIDLISEGSNETGATSFKIICKPDEFAQFDFDRASPGSKTENAQLKMEKNKVLKR